jgi:hypothetical protein
VIVAAAVRIHHCVCTMAAPARHHDILRQIAGMFDPEERPDHTYEAETQGFITDTGHFIERREALIHARECGQVLRRKPGIGYQGDELFSEDLW